MVQILEIKMNDTQCEGRDKTCCKMCDLECGFRVAGFQPIPTVQDIAIDRLIEDLTDGGYTKRRKANDGI